MDRHYIIFIYYVLIICILFILLYKGYRSPERKYYRGRNTTSNIKKVISILNNIMHKIGSICTYDPKKKIGILNIRILRIIEEDEGIVMTPESFIGYKVFLCLSLSIASMLFGDSLINSILLGTGIGTLGYFIPDLLIRRQARRISAIIDIELPYMVDLLRVAVISGQNIYNSFSMLIEKYKAKICFDLRDFIRDIELGSGKETAYNNMIEKNRSKQFTELIAVLLEAEKYGSPLDEILRQKSDQINFENTEKSERKARKVSILTLLPLVFLILPAFILLAGGPLIYIMGKDIFIF